MSSDTHTRSRLSTLTLAALGVVYGDIGTSPLYALKECFSPELGLTIDPSNVYGVLSLVIWALLLLISVKYIAFVMRADNRGEGGILALLSLAVAETPRGIKRPLLATLLLGMGVFGAALLYGDGMITPAVSVLGAMEGLEVASTSFHPFIVPLSTIVLLVLFAAQYHGTGAVGTVFGPIMIVWFATISVLGAVSIAHNPSVLASINPWYGIQFLIHNRWLGFKVMGSVFLAVTGGEALYADMGHFGARPIRIAWFGLVLPSLLLNYLGQGALILGNPAAIDNPFYKLAPHWMLYPLVGLATIAAVIASQALISGVYSLTMQSIQMGFLPRMTIDHTSERERGQIYMPQVNWVLAAASILLVLAFKTSSNLAAAYGIAVTLTMLATTVLFYFAAQRLWNWSPLVAGALCTLFGVIEISFFGANALKILNGGWYPLAVGVFLFTLMSTWKTGRRLLWQRVKETSLPLEHFLASLDRREPNRVKGTAIYLASNPGSTPLALLHNLKHNKVLHERVVFLNIVVEEQPTIDKSHRVSVTPMPHGFWRVQAHFGFMEEPNVVEVLKSCGPLGVEYREHEATFFLSRETILPAKNPGMARWREHLFSLMSRNAQSATAFFRIPPSRVVELGMQVEI
jgi:KUP system potassium uptake protein